MKLNRERLLSAIEAKATKLPFRFNHEGSGPDFYIQVDEFTFAIILYATTARLICVSTVAYEELFDLRLAFHKLIDELKRLNVLEEEHDTH